MGSENRSRLSLAKRVLEFCLGTVIGFTLACLTINLNYSSANLNLSQFFQCLRSPAVVVDSQINVTSYEAIRSSTGAGLPISAQSPDATGYDRKDVEAERLAKQVRVLCWIMTRPSNHKKKAIHVKKTWGKRCNKLIFMSSQSDEKLGAVALPNVQEGRDWLWAKTKEAFKYVWEHHRDEADWFMKADDDTYVIVENLRLMLSHVGPEDPVYFGCRFKLEPYIKQGYMSGGSGYVLSREALRRFVEQALPDKNKCKESHEGSEDVQMSRCLQAVGVEIGDSRDKFGRDRFFQFNPEQYVMKGGFEKPWSWYWERIWYPHMEGMECCSDSTISFHYITPNQMHSMEYLIYHLRVYYNMSYKALRNGTEENFSTTVISTRIL